MNKHQQHSVPKYRFLGLVFLTVITLALVLSIEGAGASEGQASGHVHQGGLAQAGHADAAVASGVAPQRPAGCVNGQPYSDVEPNSTITEAQYLSSINTTEISASIVPTGDIDYFSFNATAGDRIWAYAYTLSSTSGTDSQLQLVNSMSQTIQFDDGNGSQTSLSAAIAGAYITQTGITYLRPSQYLNFQTIEPYRLFVDRTSSATVAETEPNNQQHTANAYALGTVVTGTIPITTDMDIYGFAASAGDKVVIQVDGDPERDNVQLNPNIYLFNNTVGISVDNDATFCSVDCPGTLYRSENYFYSVPATAMYYVRVSADTQPPNTGTYNLHIFVVSTTNCPTATPTSALTSTSTATNTPTNTRTSTQTATRTATSTATRTNTAAPTQTPDGSTATSMPSNTPVPTSTIMPTGTPGAPTPTPTACTIAFADVPPDNTFYPFVRCMACRGIISGYPCGNEGEPCNPASDPYFRPSSPVTRGQLAKIVSNSAGFSDPASGQSFEDVPPGSAFYPFIERLTSRGVMSGYSCSADPNEPCGPASLPYFRPGAGATRGQLTKIVSNAAGFDDVFSSTYTFTDVPPGSAFHIYVERLLLNRPEVMGGYPCGGSGEPCDSQKRSYFRPSSPLSRGQTSKIVGNTFYPNCQAPAP